MALNYKRLTEEQDNMRNVVPKGEYPFSVKYIEQKKTRSGAYDMLEINLSIVDSNGREMTVKDWLVFMDEMSWKLRHFADTCGLLAKYDNNTLDAKDFLGKKGIAKLTIAEYEQDGEVRKVNRVSDYVKSTKAQLSSVQKTSNTDNFLNDDIPF